jgi:hypothetical protein
MPMPLSVARRRPGSRGGVDIDIISDIRPVPTPSGHNVPSAPAQRQAKAVRYQVIGWSLRVVALLLAFSAVLIPVSIALVAASYWVIRRGKKHAAALADVVLAEDARPPIVYLRSFNDEEDDSRLVRYLRPGQHDIAQTTPAWGPREQDAMAPIMSKIGPYVAIGKPREGLPELGAARAYVSDDKWQAQVLDWIARARLVIVRAGATEGLRWEVGQLVAHLRPTQLLVILPPREEHYEAFSRWANDVLPSPLPQSAPKERLVMFDQAWRPILLPARPTISKSLAPYFAQNDIQVHTSYFEDFLEHNGLR